MTTKTYRAEKYVGASMTALFITWIIHAFVIYIMGNYYYKSWSSYPFWFYLLSVSSYFGLYFISLFLNSVYSILDANGIRIRAIWFLLFSIALSSFIYYKMFSGISYESVSVFTILITGTVAYLWVLREFRKPKYYG